MKNYKLKIFCDFDGTITKKDVWINSIEKFIKEKEKFDLICDEFYAQKISTRECNLRQLELVEDFSFEKFNEYLEMEEIDEYFREFLNFCKERSYEVYILSGGLDYYIDYILKREKLDVKFFSTKLITNDNETKLSCEFPYSDEYCIWCETCKRNILINFTNDLVNEVSIYIGDGVSDFCVSDYADIVFAKGRLASHCWKNNITYFEYKNFLDVMNKIIKLTEKNKIKQRQESLLKRKDVLMGG